MDGGVGSRIVERRDRGRASRLLSALMFPSLCVVEGMVRLDDVRGAASPCEKEEREGVVCLPSLDALARSEPPEEPYERGSARGTSLKYGFDRVCANACYLWCMGVHGAMAWYPTLVSLVRHVSHDEASRHSCIIDYAVTSCMYDD